MLEKLGQMLSASPDLVFTVPATIALSFTQSRGDQNTIVASRELEIVFDRLTTLHEMLRQKQVLDDFLKGTEHAHMLQGKEG
ncbi:MAG: hypothetical protein OXC69_08675 [Candidatus Tectomicrobia bacterium]|nr:hypothetical protein [Candidatus Tectomicrobia bacterium]